MSPQWRLGSWACPFQWKPRRDMRRRASRQSSCPTPCASLAMRCKSWLHLPGPCECMLSTCTAFLHCHVPHCTVPHSMRPHATGSDHNRHRDTLPGTPATYQRMIRAYHMQQCTLCLEVQHAVLLERSHTSQHSGSHPDSIIGPMAAKPLVSVTAHAHTMQLVCTEA